MKKIIATMLCALACGCEVESETDPPEVVSELLHDKDNDLPGCGGAGGSATTTTTTATTTTTTGGLLICDPERAFDGNSTCFMPKAGCCDMPPDTDLVKHCDVYTDGKYAVPVFCSDAGGPPVLNDITCVALETTSFACMWGVSTLYCCGITN